MNEIERFNERRTLGNDRILKTDDIILKRFFALDNRAYSDGKLNGKSKELIGLACSMVLRCNDCIAYHIEQAKVKSATKDEIIETMEITLIVGGSIVIPHLRYAFQILDELFPDKSDDIIV